MPVNKKIEPQLSADVEKQVREKLAHFGIACIGYSDDSEPMDKGAKRIVEIMIGDFRKIIATALEEQKKATLDLLDKAELEKWFDMPDTTENWKTWKKIRNTINREDV